MNTQRKLEGKRYIIVARCSTDKQEASIPDQVKLCREFCERMGGIHVDTVELEGVPGSNFRNIDRIVEGLIARKRQRNDFDGLLFQDPTRLARSGGDHGGKICHELRQAGIDLAFTTGDVEGPYGSMVRQFQFELGRDQVRRGSHTIARGLTSALLGQRRLYCNQRPFATALGILNAAGECTVIFRDRPDGSQVKIDQRTSEIVEQFPQGQRYRKQKFEVPVLLPGEPRAVEAVGMIYRLHLLDDLGTARIARALNDLDRAGPNGRPWTASSVQGILDNCIYSGIVVAQRLSNARFHRAGLNGPVELDLGPAEYDPESGRVYTVIRKADEWLVAEDQRMRAFLPEDVRERARQLHRAMLDRQKEGRKPQPRRDAARDSNFLLAGLLRSATGGHSMSGTQGGPNGGYRYYRVNPRTTKSSPAVRGRIRAEGVEEAVLAAVHKAIFEDPAIEATLVELLKTQYDEARGRRQRRFELEAELKDLQNAAVAAYGALGRNEKTAELALANLEPRIRSVQQELETAIEVPDLSDEQIRGEAAAILQKMRTEADLLRLVEPGRAKQLLNAVVGSLTVDLATCEIQMTLRVPEAALAGLGPLQGLVYQSLKRTQTEETELARRSLLLPEGTCCHRRRRAA